MKKEVKRFHFCKKDFYEKLMSEGVIHADDRVSTDNNKYAYKYAFSTPHRLNNGNGMFFTWKNPLDLGYEIKYSEESNADYVLLEIDIPKELTIDTDYQNWCSFILDLYDADGDVKLANEYCIEDGIVGGIEGSYNAIFDIDNTSAIQTLIPYIKSKWIKSVKYTKNIIV